jgi:hypothetical protein
MSESVDLDFDCGSSIGLQAKQPEKKNELGQAETKAVYCIKLILVFILILAAAALSTFVYLYTSQDETDEFEETFSEFSQLIIDTVQTNAQNRLEAVGALAAQIQAYAINSNSTWPFVTLPFFEEHVNVMKSLTDAYGILLFPVVSDYLRADWERYSLENSHWVNESFATQMEIYGVSDQVLPEAGESWFDVLWGDGYKDPNNPDFSAGISDSIFRSSNLEDPEIKIPTVHETRDLYFPQWQVAPMSRYYQSSVNNNYGQFDDFFNSTIISIETGNAVLGIAWTDPYVGGYISTMLYPIFDRFHVDDKTVVAFLGADISWQDYLTDILPKNAKGIVVVIENNYGQNFTYQLSGGDANFTGEGDHHDTAYDSMVQTALFGQHLQEPITSASYTGAPLYGGFIQYIFRIYPSRELEEQYVTRKPFTYTIVICAIFVFTSLIFIAYDCLVERRQKLVLTTAIMSDAIVDSLFPSNVKERLYRGDKVGDDHNEEPSGRGGDTGSEMPMLQNATNKSREGPPIADLFENATVCFAGTLSGRHNWISLI